MVSHQPTGEEIFQHIRARLEPDRKIGNLISVPTLLVQESWLTLSTDAGAERRVEDAVLGWFRGAGFDGDRTRNNFYGNPALSGYPGLFQKLNEPPPWVQVTLDDHQGNITVEREKELTPLYLQIDEHNDLEQRFEAYVCERYASVASMSNPRGVPGHFDLIQGRS